MDGCQSIGITPLILPRLTHDRSTMGMGNRVALHRHHVESMEGLTMSDWTSCDRCPATAKRVARKGEAELLFCDHHMNQHELGLIAQGWDISVSESEEQCSAAIDFWEDGTPIPVPPEPSEVESE